MAARATRFASETLGPFVVFSRSEAAEEWPHRHIGRNMPAPKPVDLESPYEWLEALPGSPPEGPETGLRMRWPDG